MVPVESQKLFRFDPEGDGDMKKIHSPDEKVT